MLEKYNLKKTSGHVCSGAVVDYNTAIPIILPIVKYVILMI